MARFIMPGFFHGLTFASIIFSSTIHAECSMQTLVPEGEVIHANGLTINLGEANNAKQPTAWQGPLVTGSCKLDIGIIEQPLKLGAERYFYVPTYSGSTRKLSLIDLKACKIYWQSKEFSSALQINSKGLELDNRHVKLDGACLPKSEAWWRNKN